MKKLSILCLILGLVFAACDNDDDKTVVPEELTIIGQWNWVQSTGGFTGNDSITPETTGNEKAFKFYSNDTVEIITDGDISLKTNYTLKKEKSMFTKDSAEILTIYKGKLNIPGNSSPLLITDRYRVVLDKNNLTLEDEAYDGYCHEYKR